MKLIAIVGKKRVGKDTCASFIKEQCCGSVVYSLSDPIKKVLYNTRPESMKFLNYRDFDGLGVDRDTVVLPIRTSQVIRWLLECVFELHKRQHCDIMKEIEVRDVVMKIAKENNYKWTIRLLLTTFGTDIMVNIFDQMFWCKMFLHKYNTNKHKDGYFIVPDIRQEWEIDLVRSMGAMVIHIYKETGLISHHITEKGLTAIGEECIIVNDGTIEDFKEAILKIVK